MKNNTGYHIPPVKNNVGYLTLPVKNKTVLILLIL